MTRSLSANVLSAAQVPSMLDNDITVSRAISYQESAAHALRMAELCPELADHYRRKAEDFLAKAQLLTGEAG